MSRGFFRSTAVVGVTTLLSRITGLAREMVFAAIIPAVMLEVYVLANQIPNLLRRLFAEGAFSQAFVPVVAEYRAKRSTDEVRELVDSVAGTLGGILAVVSILGVIVAPVIVWICAPGFASKQAGQFELAVEVLRWTFPYLLFVSLTALAGGVLNSYQKFALPAFASVALNVVMIVFAAWISPYFEQPVLALAIGVFVGGIAAGRDAGAGAAAAPPGALAALEPAARGRAAHRALMGPAIIGSSMGQLSVMLSTAIASLLADGSMTWLFFADRLVEFPLGVFSIALATVILPSLSAHHAQETPAEFAETLAWALRLVCLIVIPASVAMLALAGPLTVAIYHRGQFTGFDVDMTQRALMGFSLALLGWSLIKVLATGYYARQDTKGPVRVAMRSLGVTMALNLLVLAGLWLTGNLKSAGAHTLLAADERHRRDVERGPALHRSGAHGHHPARPRHARPARAHRDRELRDGGLAGLARRRPRVLARRAARLARVLRLSGLIARGHRRLFRRSVAARRAGAGSSGCRPWSGSAGRGVG